MPPHRSRRDPSAQRLDALLPLLVLLILLYLLAAARVSGQEASDTSGGPYFYHGYDYGSEAYAGPLDVVLNKGFALAQVMNRSQRIFGYDYGWEGLFDGLAHPLRAVERSGGWGHVVRRELLPLTADSKGSSWWPNYFGHIVEGGITTRKMTEWYDARGMPVPWLFAGLTTMTASVLNEAYESPGRREGSAASVVDLYLFDPLGMLIFGSDRVAGFFAHDLNARVWPGQASFALPSGELLNNANHLIFKLPVLPGDGSSLFVRTGIGGHVGLTFHGSEGMDWSLGFGADASRQNVDPDTGVETVNLAWSGGFYVDRNGSLLASLSASRLQERALTLNLYPGVIHDELGAWVNLTLDGRLQLGLTSRSLMGAGLALGF